MINIYKFIGKKDQTYELDQKLNANCKQEEKSGSGPGSCGGSTGKSEIEKSTPTDSSISTKNFDHVSERVSEPADDNDRHGTHDMFEKVYKSLKLSGRDRDAETFKKAFLGAYAPKPTSESKGYNTWQAMNDVMHFEGVSPEQMRQKLKDAAKDFGISVGGTKVPKNRKPLRK